MRRGSFRDRALVVRTYDFGEADRIVVLLTRQHGLVRAVAKGVRRARSRFGSRIQRFVLLDVECYPGKSLALISGADTVDYYASGIIEDYQRYSAACAVLETAEKLSLADLPDSALFDLAVSALEALRHDDTPLISLDIFLLHAMGSAGWLPEMFNCAHCDKPGPHRGFDPGSGGAVCSECRPPGATTVPTEALRLMWWMAHGHYDAMAQAQQADPARWAGLVDTAHRLITDHVQYHLERGVLSLRAD
ncbi:DNA repair protein RecO [Corynebacterium ciconiae DSM 44920]|uniref:DNA repair protein RecO n=1 Tax=Corynebacterium ciconiae TaxID=227319 RepID=UPI00035EC955|nr:DNA repair protein RecO [Corynebacterium ciconiae]WKD60671.1 DNA repair protein RecO [Corynebacterium ciconiae DSM 44920]